MRLRRFHSSSSAHAFEAVNATPLIDVVMCLIIFFLIVGKMASDRGVHVRLPETGVGQEENARSILVITVAKIADAAQVLPPGVTENSWKSLGVTVQVGSELVSDGKALENAVRQKMLTHPDTSVQVRADRELSFGSVEPVLRAAGQGGAKSVRLATERAP